jgi:hypothetical protein
LLEAADGCEAFLLFVRAFRVHFALIGADELGDEVGMHQVLLQRLENQVLENLTTDAAAVAAKPVAVGLSAPKVVLANCGERMAALSADREPGQNVARAPLLPEPALPDRNGGRFCCDRV